MDGLEKILDKLGVFNILAVFVPGLVIGTDVFLLCEIVKIELSCFSEKELIFTTVSFLLGIVFYEIGYFLFAFTRMQDKILFKVVHGNEKLQRSPHLKLCKYEYEKVKEYIYNNSDNDKINNTTNNTENNNTEENTEKNTQQSDGNKKQDKDESSDVNWEGYRVYNYCKYRVREHRNNNSIVAMSRTLFAFFILVTLLVVVLAICDSCNDSCYTCQLWIFAVAHFFLSIVFLVRTIRNYELMYATVIKEFYQSII